MEVFAMTETNMYADILKKAEKLLPAWFVPRMMMDEWFFGLVMTNGDILAVQTIDQVSQAADDTIWLDIYLLTDDYVSMKDLREFRVVTALEDRQRASVNASHVLYALELANS